MYHDKNVLDKQLKCSKMILNYFLLWLLNDFSISSRNNYRVTESCKKKMHRDVQRILHQALPNVNTLQNYRTILNWYQQYQNQKTHINTINRVYSDFHIYTGTHLCVCVFVCVSVCECIALWNIITWVAFCSHHHNQYIYL